MLFVSCIKKPIPTEEMQIYKHRNTSIFTNTYFDLLMTFKRRIIFIILTTSKID
jgi:hypothetical protein